jgi:hypothetical protein
MFDIRTSGAHARSLSRRSQIGPSTSNYINVAWSTSITQRLPEILGNDSNPGLSNINGRIDSAAPIDKVSHFCHWLQLLNIHASRGNRVIRSALCAVSRDYSPARQARRCPERPVRATAVYAGVSSRPALLIEFENHTCSRTEGRRLSGEATPISALPRTAPGYRVPMVTQKTWVTRGHGAMRVGGAAVTGGDQRQIRH